MSVSPRVLAVASSGGHLVQLLRVMPAFEGCQLTVASTDPEQASEVDAQAERLGLPKPGFRVIIDANRWQKLRLTKSLLGIAWLVYSLHPDVVITTGAAPGYFALRFGKMIGARTIWLDSIANAEELSLAGQKAGAYTDLWLTQWAHLAQDGGPHHEGAVL
ncbi:MAG: UDP-N-acetylglucosamine--LPS N-acetylglucosamine transferase [bacterium]|nr:UDP-N-acetylglucosamine--LPS N-acetylglucosamine transferase [bacterium]